MAVLELISNDVLHKLTLNAAKNEKSATMTLLDHLAEVDHRRLYSIMSYSSLWEYVHKALQYSEAQASERVSAMRLMVKVPEVKKALEEGRLSLTATAKLASHVRREKYAPSESLPLLHAIVGKSSREIDRVLAAEAGFTPIRPDQIRPISTETTRITIDVNREFLDLMKRVQELGGHAGSSAQDVFVLAMKDFIERRTVKKTNIATQSKQASTMIHSSVLIKSKSPVQTDTKKQEHTTASRYISMGVKRETRIRSGDQCEYINPATQRRCSSKTDLEFDHIIPFAANGPMTANNLRHFCATHNRLATIQYFGLKKMQNYLKCGDRTPMPS